MTRLPTRPSRRMRSELLTLSAVLAMPVALAALFPYRAVAFRPCPPAPLSDPSCAFVRLSPGAEEKAMEKVRAALSVRKGRITALTANLSLSTLSEEPPGAIVSESDMGALPEIRVSAGEFIPFPPSLASPEPEKMEAAEPEKPSAPFPRDDLLKPRIN